MSQARMRVLKPQVDEIAKKYPADKAGERQQAIMRAFYKQAEDKSDADVYRC